MASLVAAATVTLAVVGGLGWIGQGASSGIPTETAVIRVGAGETVWDVARRVAPQSDQRAVVKRIRQLNGLVGSAITPGQQLQVPNGR
ncbi:MAG: LysM peptidoglycan-binding domain-containing protein [Pseudonocardiales bacterium]|nr:LysM peptidoglycan-binding domain-containing protein [Pseudonocardiales bacterium]MBV9728648.1 LysM peptidoglycan-binding domain-containing protein [Pseudonocardiales bacterium]